MNNEYSDFFTYLSWRGDIPFTASPFNAVDALILCQIAYLDLECAVPKCENSAILLKNAARLHEELRAKKIGLMINEQTAELFFEAAKTKRFGDIALCDVVNKYDEKSEEQFFALTFLLDKHTAFVAFRGTDDTIVGWKEDFNLAFVTPLPAQKDALAYLTDEAGMSFIKKVIVGGHSKGGNLALYASAQMTNYKDKIASVYNFDGPGFSSDMLSSPPFRAIENITHSYYPQLSIIGQLFSHFESYTVVKSNAQFIMQHDPFSWAVGALGFEEKEDFEAGSKYFHKTFNEWYISLEKDKREQFVNALFAPLAETDYKNLSSLSSHWLQASSAILKALNEMDNDIKLQTKEIIASLFSVAQKNFGVLIAKNS